jgi:hypothetical protein
MRITLRHRREAFLWWLGDTLVSLACRIDPETRHEQRRLREAFDTCEDIARGKVAADKAQMAAYAAVY